MPADCVICGLVGRGNVINRAHFQEVMPAPGPVVELAYDELGPNNAVPIVLLHGFPFDRRMWKATAPKLAEAGYRVVVPDLRGHGKSPLGVGEASMQDMGRDVVALMEKLNLPKAILLGFSMGGYVALQIATRNPEALRALALVDTRAEADNEAAKAGRVETAKKVAVSGMQVLVEGMLPKLTHPDTAAKQPEVVKALEQLMRDQDPKGAIAALQGLGSRPDMKGRMKYFGLPALVVVGEADQITPMEAASSLAQAISYSEYQIISGAGHAVPIEQPEAFNRTLLDWLRRVARAN